MVATLYLLSGLLVPAQVLPSAPPGRMPQVERRESSAGDYLLTPRLVSGQELIYRGVFTEQAGPGQVQLNRSWRLETRAFVLDADARGFEVALLTLLRDQTVAGVRPGDRVSLKPSEQGEVRSARLERVGFDLRGQATGPAGCDLSVPIEGPPLLECGFCVAVPAGRIGIEKPWVVGEKGRPDTRWRVVGTELVGGTSCMHLEGVQESEDWAKPRAEKVAWRRRDSIWLSPRTGVAQRVERRIEHRVAGREDTAHVGLLIYDLQSALQYPVALADDRRRELSQSLQLQQTVRPLLSQPVRHGSQFDTFLTRLKAVHDAHAETPYREALAYLRTRLEMAKRGEAPPPLPSDLPTPEKSEPPKGLTIGKPAPDFVASELNGSGRSQGLKNWRGRPILLIFFNPRSRSLAEMMYSVCGLAARYKDVALVGLAMNGDPVATVETMKKRHWDMPLLTGSGLRISYNVVCTPKLVFIDADGIVQGVVESWGSETADEIANLVPRWIRR